MKCVCPTDKNFVRNAHNLCVCKNGFSINTTTNRCENFTTSGEGKIGGTESSTTVKTKTPTLSPTATTTTATTGITGDVSKIRVNQNKSIEPWVYILAGSAGSIVLIAFIIGIYLGHQKVVKRKRHRRNSFTFHLEEQDRHFQDHREFSMQTVTTECSTSLYRPYMTNIGSVVRIL